MDAPLESCEPPPSDPQPPGKIRKALKLFGKRKPGSGVGSIFSLRNKGESGTKSPPTRSKTMDGLTETAAPEAQELEEEGSQKERSTEEESVNKEADPVGTPARQSISSMTSAKSLSFLTLLRRSQRGGEGERQAQTESHRTGRQRKGLKGLFGSIHLPRREKGGVEEAPSGPLLLASRSNSVEIIKEDLTLTPRPVLRVMDGPESERLDSLAPKDGTASSDSSRKVSDSKLVAQPPTTSTNDRLSTLLSDISSILTFDSLTEGGDIVADVEAEWVKASSRVEGAVNRNISEEAAENENFSSAAIATKSTPTPMTKATLSSTSTFTPSSSAKPTASPAPSSVSSPSAFKPAPTPASTTTPATTKMASITSPTTTIKPSPAQTPIPKPLSTATPTIKPTLSATNLATSITSTSKTISANTPEKQQLLSQTKQNPISVSDLGEKSESIHTIGKTTTLEPIPLYMTTPPSAVSPPPYISKQVTAKPATCLFLSPAEETKTSISTSPGLVTPLKPSSAPVITPNVISATSYSPVVVAQSPPTPIITTTESPEVSTKSPSTVAPSTSSTSPPPPVITLPPKALSTIPTTTALSTMSRDATKPASSSISLPVSSASPGTNTAQTPIQKKEEGEKVSISSGKEIVCWDSVDNSDLPQPQQEVLHTVSHDPSPIAPQLSQAENKNSMAKPALSSKIPVCGGGKPGKQPPREAQPNGNDSPWNPPTPQHEDDSQKPLPWDETSQDTFSDLLAEPGAVLSTVAHNQEDVAGSKLTHPLPASSGRQTKGAISLPRESKIPVKQGSTPTYHSLQGKSDATRSKIPVSKVPVRRTSNKPASTATTTATRHASENTK